MATPVRRLFLWKKLNAVNLAKLGSNCNLQPEEKRQLQKSGHWLLWDKSTLVNIAQPGWRGVDSSSSQVNKPAEGQCKSCQSLVDSVLWILAVQ